MRLDGKRLILGVTGGIAAYKAAELCRLLMKDGATVRVAMSPGARHFISPLTFQALSGRSVITDIFDLGSDSEIRHVEEGALADAIVVAPCTADGIARLAHGRADEPVSTVVLASRCPVVLAPGMESAMWDNLATQSNISRLTGFTRFSIIGPDEGALASGRQGVGRMAPPEAIVEGVRDALTPKNLLGNTLLVTAGPTREPLDPIRFISNRSTGKMGYALARSALRHGAQVILVSGPTDLPGPSGAEIIRVETAEQMLDACLSVLERCQIVIASAAVADFKPRDVSPTKIKKSTGMDRLDLLRTPDVLAQIGSRAEGKLIVGFTAETEELEERALEKMARKKTQLMVANRIGLPGLGFGAEMNEVTMFDQTGGHVKFGPASKDEVADLIIEHLAAFLSSLL